MKILAYTDAYEFGGAETILSTLLGALGRELDVTLLGVDAAIVGRVAESRPDMESHLIAPVHGKRDLRGIAAHLRAVRRLRPDVLHASLRHPWSCQYGLLAGLLTPGVRTVAWQHAILGPRNRRQAWLNRIHLSRVDAHVAIAPSQARLIEEMAGLAPGSIRVIRNGVADFEAEPAPRPTAGPIVGSVGRLSPEKGYDVLLQAVAMLPEVTVVLVGQGPDRESLERLAAGLAIVDRVRFTGWVADQHRWMAMFDVFAIPSRIEGQSLTSIEAMLAARPIVATDVGGIPDAVAAPDTGLLVPPEDPCALAAALRELLANPERRKRMGRAGRARALELFGLERMAREFEALYAEVTS